MKALAAFGLVLTTLGATLLYFFGVPHKTLGNVIVYGKIAMKVSGEEDEDVSDDVWQERLGRYVDRAQALSRCGFGLVAIGSLCQLVAVLST